MIEAVNSSVLNAQVVRASADQVSAYKAVAANPERIQEAAAPVPTAPYISPYISVDINYNKAVLQIRDSENGDVLTQFPSESRLQQQQKERAAQRTAERPQVKAPDNAPAEKVESVAPATTSVSSVSSVDVPEVSVPAPSVPAEGPSYTAQAQIASQALSAGASTGAPSPSASVSLFA